MSSEVKQMGKWANLLFITSILFSSNIIFTLSRNWYRYYINVVVIIVSSKVETLITKCESTTF